LSKKPIYNEFNFEKSLKDYGKERKKKNSSHTKKTLISVDKNDINNINNNPNNKFIITDNQHNGIVISQSKNNSYENGNSISNAVNEVENKIKKIQIQVPGIPKHTKRITQIYNGNIKDSINCNNSYNFGDYNEITKITEQSYAPINTNINIGASVNKNKNKRLTVIESN